MFREIRTVDTERGIVCCTTEDERFYARKVMDKWDFVPSVTWIADHYPKGVGFYKWLATKGWDEAEALRIAAGEKGSRVHQAISILVAGGEVSLSHEFPDPRTGESKDLSANEYEAVMSFCDWFNEVNPEVIDFDYTVWNEHYRYAGTVDLKCIIDKKVWIIDVKTSPNVWPSMELQVSAYKHADKPCQKVGILQVGYRRNKKKFKFTPVADQFQLFLSARKIWAKETAGTEPLQRDFPLSLKLRGRDKAVSGAVSGLS